MKLFSTSIHSLEKGLHFSTAKHKAISNNISNVDTPNFKRQDVKPPFQQIYQQQLLANKTDARHVEFTKKQPNMPYKLVSSNNSYSHNGNSVDIDKEMSELAQNQIYYYTLIDQLSGKFQSIQNVVKGGRG
ncbi:flagellar basal body rod protein FlgB [Bacillus sp. FJAT-45066]|uniref:flagellar basal body rod protein FlgB n=1 Tax=Bacillus sp. FJAT-45066 TaxID=2011010 RepID=UPI000BB80668|nr:flagellar basal body rod protein FlgB [Bacillus sp. FJAT-45066]